MKRALHLLCLSALCLGDPTVARLAAQDASRAAAIAAQQEADERYRRLSASVDDLLSAQSVQQKRIAALADEIRQVREESLRNATKNLTSYVTRDELKRLTEQLQEVDRRRQEDKELILKEIRKLAQAPPVVLPAESSKSTSANVTKPPKNEKTEPATKTPEEEKKLTVGVDHVIKNQGETIGLIAEEYNKAYKDEGKKTSVKLIKEANPTLNERKLYIGKKIFIPLVENKK